MRNLIFLFFLVFLMSCSTNEDSSNNQNNTTQEEQDVSADELLKRDQERADSLKKALNIQ